MKGIRSFIDLTYENKPIYMCTCSPDNPDVQLLLSTSWLAPRETVSFVSQKPSMFPEAKQRETLRSRANKTDCFLGGGGGESLSVLLLIPPNAKLENTVKKSFAL